MNSLRRLAYVTLLALLCMNTFSCKKSTKTPAPFDNDPIATRTRRYLTQSKWQEVKLEYQQQDGVWVEKPLAPAVASATNLFSTNDTYIVYNSDRTVQSSGVYAIIGDNTQLELNNNITYNFSILNDTTMQLTLTAQIPYTDPSTNVTYTYYGMRQTFVH